MTSKNKPEQIESAAKPDGGKASHDWLVLGLSILTMLVIPFLIEPMLFTFGAESHRAFLASFSIWAGFPIDTNQTYMESIPGGWWLLLVLKNFILKEWFALLMMLVVLFAYFGTAYWLLKRLSRLLKKCFPALEQTADITLSAPRIRKPDHPGWIAFFLFASVAYPLSLLMLVVSFAGLISSLAVVGGQARADELKLEYRNHGCRPSIDFPQGVCVALLSGKKEILGSGMFIDKSDKEIAIYEIDHAVTLSLPTDYEIRNIPDTGKASAVAQSPKQH